MYLCILQVPSSPPPLAAPIARRLSVSASVAGEEGLFSTVLTEELLVEILADRLQVGHGIALYYDNSYWCWQISVMVSFNYSLLGSLEVCSYYNHDHVTAWQKYKKFQQKQEKTKFIIWAKDKFKINLACGYQNGLQKKNWNG